MKYDVLTLDTQVFTTNNFDFDGGWLAQVKQFKDGPIDVVISSVVAREARNQLSEKIPYFQLRHIVKPGLTGWAQINYPYGNTVEDALQKLQYDLYYVKNHTLFLDLVVLVETVGVVLTGRGAR